MILSRGLGMHQSFLDERPDSRMVRSVLTSLWVDVDQNWREIVSGKVLTFQDELLGMQQGGDNTVVQVIISAIEVARTDCGDALKQRTP